MFDLTADTGDILDFATIISTNFLAVPGILLWGWSIYDLLVLYWGESAIILFLTVVSLIVFGPPVDRMTGERQIDPAWDKLHRRILMSGIIALAFGLFWVVHGAFIGGIRKEFQFPTVPLDAKLVAVLPVLAALAVSQLVQFFRDAYRVFSKHQSKPNYAKTTFGLTTKLHVGLLITAFVTIAVGFPRPLLVGLVVAKVAYELSL